ncbi:MAG: acireductone synthase [Acidobacteria bacterium]|nr:acireductone synthase [Acidobacteriota bacterium]
MNLSLNEIPVSALLLDIEGTTSAIDFVYQTLFPFARRRLRDYLEQHWYSGDVRADLTRLREEHAADVNQGLNPPSYKDDSLDEEVESAVAYLHWMMDRDRKSTPLKSLQGKIWEEGYRAGELMSQVFADVPRAFERWRKQEKQIFIFSSGSVLAQKLLFEHTEFGDLTVFISGYFDTNIGAKSDIESYRRIAGTMQLPPSGIVFVSDVTRELEAARTAGMHPVLSVRPGNHPQSNSDSYPAITTFDEL